MNELDFDELDQAVNAIMDDPAKSKAKRAPRTSAMDPLPDNGQPLSVNMPDESPVQTPQVSPTPPTVAVVPTVVDTERSVSRLSIPPRRRGVAMDIVQTSRTPGLSAPSVRPSREAPSLSPTAPIVSEPIIRSAPATIETSMTPVDESSLAQAQADLIASINVEEPKEAELPVQKPFLSAEEESSKQDQPAPEHTPEAVKQWPDPLELPDLKAGNAENTATPITAVESPSSQPPSLHSFESTVPDAPYTPEVASEPINATPFLSTRVAKRPLGAFAESPAATPPVVSPLTNNEEPAPQKELTPELMAVESNVLPAAPTSHQTASPETTASLASNFEDARHMAIPQQYHTELKEATDNTRPVFDTTAYHTPLLPEHTPHRSSAKSWIMLIILVLLIIAGTLAYLIFSGIIDLGFGAVL